MDLPSKLPKSGSMVTCDARAKQHNDAQYIFVWTGYDIAVRGVFGMEDLINSR